MISSSKYKKTGQEFIYLIALIYLILITHSSNSIASQMAIEPDSVKLFYTMKNQISIGPLTKKLLNQSKVEIFNLDTVDLIENKLSKGLPNNLKQSEAIAQKRIDKFMNNDEMLNAMKQGYMGFMQAKAMGLTKSPAIVFVWEKELFVVYGEQHSDIALHKFQQYITDKVIKR